MWGGSRLLLWRLRFEPIPPSAIFTGGDHDTILNQTFQVVACLRRFQVQKCGDFQIGGFHIVRQIRENRLLTLLTDGFFVIAGFYHRFLDIAGFYQRLFAVIAAFYRRFLDIAGFYRCFFRGNGQREGGSIRAETLDDLGILPALFLPDRPDAGQAAAGAFKEKERMRYTEKAF